MTKQDAENIFIPVKLYYEEWTYDYRPFGGNFIGYCFRVRFDVQKQYPRIEFSAHVNPDKHNDALLTQYRDDAVNSIIDRLKEKHKTIV